MTHITVSFVGGVLHVNPDLFPGRGGTLLEPGDIVTWELHESVGQRALQVVFSEMVELNPTSGAPVVGTRRPADPMGPFRSLSLGAPGARQIVGTVGPGVPQDPNRPRRYFYEFFENDLPLPKVAGPNLMINGGGIDIPRTPPA